MSRIRGTNTRPEVVVRSVIHSLGCRFRLRRYALPGTPDVVLPSKTTAVFVHGCFWHRHQGCYMTYTPKSRVAFWKAKFATNVRRDRLAVKGLQKMGWRVVVVWECQTRDRGELSRVLRKQLARRQPVAQRSTSRR